MKGCWRILEIFMRLEIQVSVFWTRGERYGEKPSSLDSSEDSQTHGGFKHGVYQGTICFSQAPPWLVKPTCQSHRAGRRLTEGGATMFSTRFIRGCGGTSVNLMYAGKMFVCSFLFYRYRTVYIVFVWVKNWNLKVIFGQ